MRCPVCHYELTAFETECPRCRAFANLPANASQTPPPAQARPRLAGKHLGLVLSLCALSLIALIAIGVLGSIVTSRRAETQARVARMDVPLGTPVAVEPGIQVYQVSLPERDGVSQVWIYLPEKPVETPMPCVLIAPAGSPLIHGMALGAGDMPEHLPYVRAGFAVIAYEIDGNLADNASDQELITAAAAFKNADAGLANERAALDYALAKVPQIDPHRVYAAGHSSAGTLSLLAAEHDSRIAGCIAYAPVCDVPARVGEETIAALSVRVWGFREFMARSSPAADPATLRCPLFLFHADDDGNVPTQEVSRFAESVQKTNSGVTFVRVPTGGHYDSMIAQGIPQAITWLQRIASMPNTRLPEPVVLAAPPPERSAPPAPAPPGSAAADTAKPPSAPSSQPTSTYEGAPPAENTPTASAPAENAPTGQPAKDVPPPPWAAGSVPTD